MHTGTHHHRRGVAHIWVIIFLLLIIALVGLAIDVNHVVLAGQELQAGADAASLAAARWVRLDQDMARQAAIDIAAANTGGNLSIQLDYNGNNNPNGDIVIGRYDRDTQQFTSTTQGANAVKVVARRTSGSLAGSLPLFFGPMVGADTAEVAKTSIAMIGGGTGAGLITLNNTAQCSLDVRGTATTLSVDGGALQVNSSHGDAVCHSGQPTITAPEINVNGSTDTNFESQVNFNGEINEGANQVGDPLAGLPEPTWDPANDLGTVSVTGTSEATVTLSPGFYSGGISMTNNQGNLVLDPGIYILDGAGLDIRGGDLLAEGVMFYIIDSTPTDNQQSHVYLGGNGNIRITPPDPDLYSYPGVATYEGVSIFQARDNTNDATIIGTNLMDIEGTLYFPNNHLSLGGEGGGFGNQLIADTMEIFGTGEITINYDGRFPAPGFEVFLVR